MSTAPQTPAEAVFALNAWRIRYDELTEQRDRLVADALDLGVNIRQAAIASGLTRQTIYNITERQKERDARARVWQPGDEVRYDGELPDGRARDGEVIARDGGIVTVEFSDGHRQDIPATDLKESES